jgi:hypothetical protein
MFFIALFCGGSYTLYQQMVPKEHRSFLDFLSPFSFFHAISGGAQSRFEDVAKTVKGTSARSPFVPFTVGSIGNAPSGPSPSNGTLNSSSGFSKPKYVEHRTNEASAPARTEHAVFPKSQWRSISPGGTQ